MDILFTKLFHWLINILVCVTKKPAVSKYLWGQCALDWHVYTFFYISSSACLFFKL